MNYSLWIVNQVAAQAQQFADRVFYQDHTHTVTYERLQTDLQSSIAGLTQLGLGSGHRIGWLILGSDKTYQDVLGALACTILGIEFCHLPIEFIAQHPALLRDIGVTRFLTFNAQTVVGWNDAWGQLSSVPMEPIASIELTVHACEDEAPYRIVFSSGSTGVPKAIQLRRDRLGSDLRVIEQEQLSRDDVILNLFSTFVVPGFSRRFMQGLKAGASQAYLPISNPERFWSDISRFEVTHIVSPVLFLSRLLKNRPESLRLNKLKEINLMGSRCSLELFDQIRSMTDAKIINYYGSTEIGSMARGEITRETIEQGLAGLISPNVELQIVDESDNVLPVGTKGVVRIRSASMVSGYLGKSGLGEPSIRDGWFYTGDQGMLGQGGRLYVYDRENDVVNMGGSKISLRALDELYRTVPGVLDCCAFAVTNADGIQEPWLALVAPPFLDMQSLFELAQQKQTFIGGTWLITSIPRSNGKPQRWKLSEQFKAQGS